MTRYHVRAESQRGPSPPYFLQITVTGHLVLIRDPAEATAFDTRTEASVARNHAEKAWPKVYKFTVEPFVQPDAWERLRDDHE